MTDERGSATAVYRLIDLFAGAGGMSSGFENSGLFRSVFAVEFHKPAAQTYAANFHRNRMVEPFPSDKPLDITEEDVVFCGDIHQVGQLSFGADLIIGGPPCQGFSPLGKISPRDEHRAMNELWQQYMRIVAQVRPLGFVIENVPQLLRSRERVAIVEMARRLGYTVRFQTLKAVDYGVPQRRVRGFIIGLLGDVIPAFPKPDHLEKPVTVRDAIGNLPLEPTTFQVEEVPNPEGGLPIQNLHIGRQPTATSLERYKAVGPGENRFALQAKRPDITPRCWIEKPTGSTDVFGRLEWDKPAYTIRTEFFKPEKGCYLHPEAHRPITHREAARLQTFDDKFYFCGSKIEIARQIGNAVPPRLAEKLARTVAPLLEVVRGQLERGWAPEVPPVLDFEETLRQVLAEVYQTDRVFVDDTAAMPVLDVNE